MKTYASGEAKYAPSSRLVMVLIFAKRSWYRFSAFAARSCFRGVRQGDAAEDFVQPAFFGVQFFDLPALGGFGDAARQLAVRVRLWERRAP